MNFDEDLAAELRALGREIAARDSADVEPIVAGVLERIADEPVPAPSRLMFAQAWLRARVRALLAVLLVLLAGLALAPPVRAAVAEWFDFGGVVIRPGPSLPTAPPPPTATGRLTLAEVERLVGFRPVVPARLGAPDRVGVSTDRRQVSMSWTRGSVRLDQFDGRVAPVFSKLVPQAKPTSVDGRQALWIEAPHQLVLLDQQGVERTISARPAGPTLLWEHGAITLRLEGVRTMTDAIDIARTVR